MKKSGLVALLVLLLCGTLLVWRWSVTPPGASSEDPAVLPTGTESTLPGTKTGVAPQVTKRRRIERLLAAVNHKDIEFYGKVIDQSDNALADVKVYASVIYNGGLSAGIAKTETTTDAAGLFSISGMKGRTLGIGLGKEGYEYGGEHGPFQFTELVPEPERYHPDPGHPVVFTMYKLRGAEAMIYGDGRIFTLPNDGTEVRIDLTTGDLVPSGGDLVVSLTQPVAEPGKWFDRYHWEARLAAAGLCETRDMLMYNAPENGYVTSLAYGEDGDETVQQHRVSARLYLRTADGRYARVQVVIASRSNPNNPSTIGLTWWLNPQPGHRNLEFDRAKAIKPQ